MDGNEWWRIASTVSFASSSSFPNWVQNPPPFFLVLYAIQLLGKEKGLASCLNIIKRGFCARVQLAEEEEEMNKGALRWHFHTEKRKESSSPTSCEKTSFKENEPYQHQKLSVEGKKRRDDKVWLKSGCPINQVLAHWGKIKKLPKGH